MTEIVIPNLGESIIQATILKWYKKVGEQVNADELLLELETEKVTLEVHALAAGTISKISKVEGETVDVGEIVGLIDAQITANSMSAQNNKLEVSKAVEQEQDNAKNTDNRADAKFSKVITPQYGLPPAAAKIAKENNIDVAKIKGTGRDGRITKIDVLNVAKLEPESIVSSVELTTSSNSGEQRVRMSRLRKTIAERLKESQNTAAILTTFNEIDMTELIKIRAQFREEFEKKFFIKLGFMSFFIKACISALKEIPNVNAEIDGDDIIYKNYYNIGVAVGTDQGLVVPVIKNAELLSFAELEQTINSFGKKAREGKISISDLIGGTFTISNGGVYGSLLSTPIINPPQAGILGMHKIQERAVVIDGKIEIRSMMYVALSYDHRLIDGKEAVTFLVKVKNALENPNRLLIDL